MAALVVVAQTVELVQWAAAVGAAVASEVVDRWDPTTWVAVEDRCWAATTWTR